MGYLPADGICVPLAANCRSAQAGGLIAASHYTVDTCTILAIRWVRRKPLHQSSYMLKKRPLQS